MTDHPRSRGVYQHDGIRRVMRRGIIPARAGFTSVRATAGSSEWDHPRSRGVYYLVWLEVRLLPGSSPLARGLPPVRRDGLGGAGIIPARAGFTSQSVGEDSVRGDHPRSRGVYVVAGGPGRNLFGSSPLARGLLSGRSLTDIGTMDHPRSRGVYAFRQVADGQPVGSSPLARGLRERTPQ